MARSLRDIVISPEIIEIVPLPWLIERMRLQDPGKSRRIFSKRSAATGPRQVDSVGEFANIQTIMAAFAPAEKGIDRAAEQGAEDVWPVREGCRSAQKVDRGGVCRTGHRRSVSRDHDPTPAFDPFMKCYCRFRAELGNLHHVESRFRPEVPDQPVVIFRMPGV